MSWKPFTLVLISLLQIWTSPCQCKSSPITPAVAEIVSNEATDKTILQKHASTGTTKPESVSNDRIPLYTSTMLSTLYNTITRKSLFSSKMNSDSGFTESMPEKQTYNPSSNTEKPYMYNSVGCPSSDWIKLSDDRCYMFVVTKSLSFHDAHKYCSRYNAEMVSIHSEELNYQIAVYLKKTFNEFQVEADSIWIGFTLNRVHNIAVPKWIDGSVVDYANFTEQPVLLHDAERCAELRCHSGEWKHSNCYADRHFACVNTPDDKKDGDGSKTSGANCKQEKRCVCAGCMTCYVFVAVLGFIILIMTRKCFWTFMKTGRIGSGSSDFSYKKAVMKDLSAHTDDTEESDDDF